VSDISLKSHHKPKLGKSANKYFASMDMLITARDRAELDYRPRKPFHNEYCSPVLRSIPMASTDVVCESIHRRYLTEIRALERRSSPYFNAISPIVGVNTSLNWLTQPLAYSGTQ
jgi:hypothetical protein